MLCFSRKTGQPLTPKLHLLLIMKNLPLLIILNVLVISGCARSTGIYEQVPMSKEVMGIGDNIRVWRDHRGIFYYVDNSGKQTNEPVHLSREQCQTHRRRVGGLLGLGLSVFEPDNSDKKAAIEMQCQKRKKWEAHPCNRNVYGRKSYLCNQNRYKR